METSQQPSRRNSSSHASITSFSSTESAESTDYWTAQRECRQAYRGKDLSAPTVTSTLLTFAPSSGYGGMQMWDFDQEDVQVQVIDLEEQIAQKRRDCRWLCKLVAVTVLGAVIVTTALSYVMLLVLRREVRDGVGPHRRGHWRHTER